jgi:NAD(P)H-dependent FMN reductase
MKKVLFIVGSLRKDSFNRQLAQTAAQLLEGKVETSFLSYQDIPFMNQDIESPTPESIARVRSEVAAADGIWIVTPEYNYSYPGVLKNLLDWLSRPLTPNDYASGTAVKGKKVVISGVSGRSAAAGSRAKLSELLGRIAMDVMEQQVGVSIDKDAWTTGVLTLSESSREELQQQAQAFLAFIDA